MKKYLTRVCPVVLGVVSVVGVSACSSNGDVSDPFVRKFTWFSFLSGDDLRGQCMANQDVLRLVYNANYDEDGDLRVIEAVIDSDGIGSVQDQQFGATDVSEVTVDVDQWRNPWGPKTDQVAWTAAQSTAVLSALNADAAFVPLIREVPIDSRDYFWVATGCHGGKPFFKAWAYPSDAYKALTFPDVLAETLSPDRVFAKAQPRAHIPAGDARELNPLYTTSANFDGIRGRMRLPQPPFKKFLP